MDVVSTPTAERQWDPDLSALRVEGGLVLGLKCGVREVVAEPGEAVFRLTSAAFIDEVEAHGQHMVYVDVLDENGRRLSGQTVEHGWPWQNYPRYDELMTDAVSGDKLAQWGLYAGYDANRVEYGPYWVRVRGKSDVFFGMGLPWNRHVAFTAVFQRVLVGQPLSPPPTNPLEGIRNAAWNALFPSDGVNYNPDAAFARFARDRNLGMPATQERDYEEYCLQGYAGGILYAKAGKWDDIRLLPW
jgi:hypothetical protein